MTKMLAGGPEWLVLAFATILVLALLCKAALRRIGLPPLVGYLLLGVGLRVLDVQLPAVHSQMARQGHEILSFLATLGVIALLFRIGLESDLPGLLNQLRSASAIWFGSVVLSALVGYVASRFLLQMDFVPSLVISVAMTATSVGIPARVWQSSDALKSNAGERFLDVAEMDDLSGVIFMALLFAVLPELQGDGHSQVALTLSRKAGWFVTKFTVFGGLCYLFSRYLEQRVTDSFRNIEADPDPMLAIVGLGLAVAAAAGLLGFSVAIGAFLAGLVFSRDPHRAKVDTSFSALYNLFTPFFFVGVGLEMDPSVALSALGVGGVLLAAAVVGKLVGTMLPAWRGTGPLEAAALGVSMVPRAEITMLIMQRANSMGPDVLPPAAYGAMVLVCAASCLLVPPILARLIPKIQSQR